EFNGFQNPYLHTPTDSMDVESYNFTLGTQAAQVVAVTIAKLAGTRAPPPVGGINIPVNKLELLAPYIGLTILLAVAVIAVSYVKKRKRHQRLTLKQTIKEPVECAHYVSNG
ncbi:MAG: hypothetical protein ACETVM_02320, partial [Candidatus Bathyarchaeia archaeon]